MIQFRHAVIDACHSWTNWSHNRTLKRLDYEVKLLGEEFI